MEFFIIAENNNIEQLCALMKSGAPRFEQPPVHYDPLTEEVRKQVYNLIEALHTSLSTQDQNSNNHISGNTVDLFDHNKQIAILDRLDLENKNTDPQFWIPLYKDLQEFFSLVEDVESCKVIKSCLMGRQIQALEYSDAQKSALSLAQYYDRTDNLEGYKQDLNNLLNISVSGIAMLYAYMALGAVCEQESELLLSAPEQELYACGKTLEALMHYGKVDSLTVGSIDYDAYRIEQHEVGFSDNEPIGTENIQQCVALIVYDPESHKTAFAHVDRFTHTKSLYTDVIDRINCHQNKYLVAYIIGGRDISSVDTNNNIRNVVQAVQSYPNIIIKDYDLYKNSIPSSIVFYPKIEKIFCCIPGNKNWHREARVNLIQDDSALNFAFDLTQPAGIPSIIFTEHENKSLIQSYWNQMNKYYYNHQRGLGHFAHLRHFAHIVYAPLENIVNQIKSQKPQLFDHTYKEEATKIIKASDIDQNTQNKLIHRVDMYSYHKKKSILNIYLELQQIINQSYLPHTVNISNRDVVKLDLNQRNDTVINNFIQISKSSNISAQENNTQDLDLNQRQAQHDLILPHTIYNFSQQDTMRLNDVLQMIQSQNKVNAEINQDQSITQSSEHNQLPATSTVFQKAGAKHKIMHKGNLQQHFNQTSKRSKKYDQSKNRSEIS